MPIKPSLNIAVSNIKEEKTINGGTRSAEDVTSHLGGISRDIIEPGQEMFLYVGTFNDRSQIPPSVAAKIKAQAARRMTASSLARRDKQRQAREAYR